MPGAIDSANSVILCRKLSLKSTNLFTLLVLHYMTFQASDVMPGILNNLSRNKSVVFIDAAVEQPNVLAQGVIPGAEVHLLSSDEDAIAQITLTLRDRTDLSAVHIISHGAPGRLLLGNGELSLNNLQDNAANLAAWFASSQANTPELLLYGCNVAAGDAGAEFIAQLRELSGVNISAASHTVGSSAKGGQWQLNAGNASAALAISESTQQRYAGVFELSPGGLAVIAYGSEDTNDRFGLVALEEIPANSVIFITDNGYDSTTQDLTNGENTIRFTVGSTPISAGTVLNNDTIGNFGLVVDSLNLNSAGDQLLVYQTDTNVLTGTPSFIYGFNNAVTTADTNQWQSGGQSGVLDSAVPEGLTVVTTAGDGGTAFGLIGHIDNAFYNGPVTGDKAALLSAISDPANWTTSDDALDFTAAPTSFGVDSATSNPGFIVDAPSQLITAETAGEDTFTVRLSKAPTDDVVLTFASSDNSEATVSGPITFTASDWFLPQTVTVTGVNEDFDSIDGFYNITATIAGDTDYAALTFPSVSGRTPDDDTAGFAVTNLSQDPTAGLTTSESGDTVSFDLALTSEPLADVTVTFSSDNTDEGTVTSEITFTPENWDTPQTVTATGVDDQVTDGGVAYAVSAVVTSTDTNYDPSINTALVLPPAVNITNLDNEANTAPSIDAQSFDIAENSASDTVVGTVVASDIQTPNDLTFEITAGDDAGFFTIDDAGVIKLTSAANLDFEGDTTSYDLTVQVTEATGATPLSQSATITLNVTDVDEASLPASIAWNTVTGVVSAFSLDVANLTGSLTPIGRTIEDTAWQLQTTGDLNGDGQDDVLLRNFNAGLNLAWYMEEGGQAIASEGLIGRTVEDPNWSMSATGDFNGDGNVDIILRNEAADQIVAWYMDGNGNIQGESLVGREFGDNNWKIEAAADFNNDGKADLLLRNGVSGQNVLWEMDGGDIIAESLFGRDIPDTNWHIEGARDFDNNGTIDVLLRQRAAGQALLWSMADKNNIATETLLTGVPDASSQLVF